ncbi:MAG: ABC transporter substrate-binding protein [Tissierellia bacterium]|nr:ABC transporter substrate-binding protein [Tissierellia bacterium]
MNTKKLFSSLLVAGMSLTLAACGSGSSSTDSSASNANSQPSSGNAAVTEDVTSNVDDFQTQTSGDTLVYGTSSMNGDWIRGFTNSSYDVMGRKLMGTDYYNGYTTYSRDKDGVYVVNKTTLTEDPEFKENEDGSKTATFKLNPDLKWSDGEAVTADDYVFASLMISDDQYGPLTGANSVGNDKAKGYKEYHAGETEEFEGVKKIDDHSFEYTISKDYLPYFAESSMYAISPLPMHSLAENLAISESGSAFAVKDGYELSDEDKENYKKTIDDQIEAKNKELEEAKAEEDFGSSDQKEYDDQIKELEDRKSKADSGDVDATDLLKEEAMLKYANEYRFKPDPVSGPYKFESFGNNMLKLTLNDQYAGNYEGKKATIPNIVLQAVNNKIAVDLLVKGDIDIWESEVQAAQIDQIRKAAEESDPKIAYVDFERNGYGKLQFLTDLGATKEKEVRQAIAFLIDRDDFVQNLSGGYAVVTNGMYGLSQWMYQEKGDELESKLTHYTLDIDEANNRLDNSSYKFEKDGKTPWDREKAASEYESNKDNFDYWRYNDKGEKLQVNQNGASEVEVTPMLNNQLPDNGKQVGMEYNVVGGDFASLLNYMYYPDEDNPRFTAFNMGTSFGTPFDPYYQYHHEGYDNTSRTNDPKADEIVTKMRSHDPEDKEGFLKDWEDFQVWFNDYLPEIPLYSNQYHNAFTTRVEGYDATPEWDFGENINYMNLK